MNHTMRLQRTILVHRNRLARGRVLSVWYWIKFFAPVAVLFAGLGVAQAATIRNGLRLNQVNLVGVYGSSSSRRALVRMPGGRFVMVTVGDRLDGGRVAAISANSLVYTKSGRNVTLEVPNG